MTTLLKVENNTSLARDVSSNAIVNTSIADYSAYMKTKEVALKKKAVLEEQAADINNLKQDMSEIKQMLAMLLKGKE